MEWKDLLAAEVLKVDRVESDPPLAGGFIMVAAGSNSDLGSDSTKG